MAEHERTHNGAGKNDAEDLKVEKQQDGTTSIILGAKNRRESMVGW